MGPRGPIGSRRFKGPWEFKGSKVNRGPTSTEDPGGPVCTGGTGYPGSTRGQGGTGYTEGPEESRGFQKSLWESMEVHMKGGVLNLF